jgi:hypothetical protein
MALLTERKYLCINVCSTIFSAVCTLNKYILVKLNKHQGFDFIYHRHFGKCKTFYSTKDGKVPQLGGKMYSATLSWVNYFTNQWRKVRLMLLVLLLNSLPALVLQNFALVSNILTQHVLVRNYYCTSYVCWIIFHCLFRLLRRSINYSSSLSLPGNPCVVAIKVCDFSII